MKNQRFNIDVNKQEYIVIPGEQGTYRIETGCDYLFTLRHHQTGEWELVDKKVVPIDDTLVPAIGKSIENTDTVNFPTDI